MSLNEKQGVIDKLDIEVEFIEKIKNGEAPPPPAMSKAGDSAVITAEPVIKIVEVNPLILKNTFKIIILVVILSKFIATADITSELIVHFRYHMELWRAYK